VAIAIAITNNNNISEKGVTVVADSTNYNIHSSTTIITINNNNNKENK